MKVIKDLFLNIDKTRVSLSRTLLITVFCILIYLTFTGSYNDVLFKNWSTLFGSLLLYALGAKGVHKLVNQKQGTSEPPRETEDFQ